MNAPETTSSILTSVLNRNLIFVHGKGGVGKTVLSQSIARCLAQKGHRTLWVALEDPTQPPGELKSIAQNLWYLNCDFTQAFEEYAAMKIRIPKLTQLFLKNKLMRYLAKAAPGIHELVLLGKPWFERLHYAHVVLDMPSTGYGLALFQSAENFAKLFRTGPLYQDAHSMTESFHDPAVTGHLIVALPEETPLRESLELNHFLTQLFPRNPAAFVVNRLFPEVPLQRKEAGFDTDDNSPLANSMEDYSERRFQLEHHNMRLWREAQIQYGEFSYFPPSPTHATAGIVEQLSKQLITRMYL
jgi:hypothetical protein